MKRKLLSGALLLGSIIAANAQSSCVDAIALQLGTTTVGAPSGEYTPNGCFAPEQGVDANGNTVTVDADAAEWYSYTPAVNGVLRINTNLPQNQVPDADGNRVDTRISVYRGTCDALTCWYSGDDVYYISSTNYNGLTDIQFPVAAGTTYYIAFDNIWYLEGFDVNAEFYEPSCATTTDYTETWSPSTSYWFCWGRQDQNNDQNGFNLISSYNLGGADVNPEPAVAIYSNAEALDDYLYSPDLTLTGGVSYTFSVAYNGANVRTSSTTVSNANESFEPVIIIGNTLYTLGDAVTGIQQTGTLATLKNNATVVDYEFTPDVDGVYSLGVHATSDLGGGAIFFFDMSVKETASSAQNAQSAFSVYPNPANTVVNVANAKAQISAVSLVDINGRTVKSVQFDGVSSAQVNIADLANGVYMMNIKSDKGTVTKKVVKN